MGVKFMVKKRYVTLEWPLSKQIWREHTIVSVPRMAGPYTIPSAARQPHTVYIQRHAGREERGRMEGGRDGWRKGREGGRKR